MPCGGIYPLMQHFAGDMVSSVDTCFYCGKSKPQVTHFCEEWDCFLHKACITPFLKTVEGKIIISHGHEVVK